ncbi:MAG: hypothetical protein ABIE23_02265 [archaeon]|nr:hypothetical protein [Candidatus Micrarchaeota archaeon]
MNKSMMIAGIVVIAVIAVAIYLFLPKEGVEKELSFGEGLNEINSIWSKNNISPGSLKYEADLDKIDASSLNSLKDDLISFKSSLSSFSQTNEVQALDNLIEVELDLIDASVSRKKVSSGMAFLDSIEYDADKMCENLPKVEGIVEDIEEGFTQTNSYNDKLLLFSQENPPESTQAGLQELNTNVTEQKIKDLKDSLSNLKVSC